MKLNFRQGLVSFQKNSASSPSYLIQSNTPGYLDLNVAPTPLVATIAHGSTDYLLVFESSVPAAFGPFPTSSDSYLFIEIDLITGQTKFGTTSLEPIVSPEVPTQSAAGQMWFDRMTNQMFVRNNSNTKFVPSPRLLLGKLSSGALSSLVMKDVGTQVNLNVEATPGFIMLDEALRPLRTSAGEFLTTDSTVRIKSTQNGSGVLASPINSYIPVRANEAIPAMSLVYFVGADAVALASSDPALSVAKTPIGIVKQALAQNEVGVITQTGEISYDQWNWAAETFGKPLYCGDFGEIVTSRPQGLQAYRIGFVKNHNTILFGIDSETLPQVYSAPGAIIHGVSPIVAVDSTNSSNENVTSISIQASAPGTNGYMSGDQASTLDAVDTQVTQNTTDIQQLQVGKADVNHTHVISDVSGLQIALDNKLNIDANFDSRYSQVGHNHDGRYALLAHLHAIADVTGLPDALSGKANVIHAHQITDITNLQSELDNRAFNNHTHTISNVSGLQAALDSKANSTHTHIITDVSGLQEALDLRSLLGHAHVINDITGLVAALAGKSDTSHTHAFTSLSDVDLTLNNGWVVSYSTSAGKFVTTPPSSGGASSLSTLSDVQLTSVGVGDIFFNNGSKWTSRAPVQVWSGIPFTNAFTPITAIAFTGSNVTVTEPAAGVTEVHFSAPDLSSRLPIAGGTLTGPLTGTSITTADLTTASFVLNGQLGLNSDPGLNGQVLTSFGPNATPTWQTPVEYFTLPSGGTSGDVLSLDFYNTPRWSALPVPEPELPSNGSTGEFLSVGPSGLPVWVAAPDSLPAGGNFGDYLSLDAYNNPYWLTPPVPESGLPTNGNPGDHLVLSPFSTPVWEPQTTELPSGGLEGQVLGIASNVKAWVDLPEQTLPIPTTAGDVLTLDFYNNPSWKTPLVPEKELPTPTGVNGNVLTLNAQNLPEWSPVPTELPSGGALGQVLSMGFYNQPAWTTPASGLPSGGVAGNVLTLISPGNPVWSTPLANLAVIRNETSSYSLQSNLASGTLIRIDSSSPAALIVGADAYGDIAVGTIIYLTQAGIGEVSIIAGSGVTINTPETLILNKQFSRVMLINIAVDVWEVEGGLRPATP